MWNSCLAFVALETNLQSRCPTCDRNHRNMLSVEADKQSASHSPGVARHKLACLTCLLQFMTRIVLYGIEHSAINTALGATVTSQTDKFSSHSYGQLALGYTSRSQASEYSRSRNCSWYIHLQFLQKELYQPRRPP